MNCEMSGNFIALRKCFVRGVALITTLGSPMNVIVVFFMNGGSGINCTRALKVPTIPNKVKEGLNWRE